MRIRAVLLPVLPIEFFLGSGSLWLGLLNPKLMHKHAEVAIKNWALRWADAGHCRRQNRRMTTQIRSNALLAWQKSSARAEDRLAHGTWPRDRNLNQNVLNAPWKRSRLGSGPKRRKSHFSAIISKLPPDSD